MLTTFYAHEGIPELSAASHARGLPLRHFAIATKLPTFSVVAHFPPPLLRAMQLAIVKQAHKSVKGLYVKIEKGQTCRVNSAPWSGGKKLVPPPAENTMLHLCRCADDHQWENILPTPITAFIIKCPKCKSNSNHARRKLGNKDKHRWLSIPCPTCRQRTASSKWQCECEVLWHKCDIHRQEGMRCCNPKALAGTIKRQTASLATATKRRHTVSLNNTDLPRAASRRKNPKCNSAAQSKWSKAADDLAKTLVGKALLVRKMPPDGDCFYHAVSDRLKNLGHTYSVTQLKQIAGASPTDEAETCHIEKLVNEPVPLYITFVPVELNAAEMKLSWEVATNKGNPADPSLSLISWTENGDGKHFDILEFRHPSREGDVAPASNTRQQPARTRPKPLGAAKRNATPDTTIRKFFKIEGGKIIRIRDNKPCGNIGQHNRSASSS